MRPALIAHLVDWVEKKKALQIVEGLKARSGEGDFWIGVGEEKRAARSANFNARDELLGFKGGKERGQCHGDGSRAGVIFGGKRRGNLDGCGFLVEEQESVCGGAKEAVIRACVQMDRYEFTVELFENNGRGLDPETNVLHAVF
jgi:hypothetical protein